MLDTVRTAVTNSPLAPGSVVMAALCALLLSLLLTRFLIWAAPRIGLVDAPDGHRKLQSQGIPLGGGIAILMSMLLTLSATVLLVPSAIAVLSNHVTLLRGLLLAVGITACIGVIDDWWEIRGRQKLAGQIIAAWLIAISGFSFMRISLLGYEIELGLLAIPFTMLWLIAAINAVNLIDGIDGLAGTISLIVASTIGLLAVSGHHTMEALLAWVLVGAIAGFLYYNWHPARIYLGDAGSMTIGLILGVLAIRVSMKGATTAGLAVPVVIWSVMFFDVAMAVLRRQLTGQSIYATDRAHFHHVLQRHGYSISQVVGVIGGASLACCLGVLLSVGLSHEWISVVNAVVVLGFIVVSGLFGRKEVVLFLRRLKHFVGSLCRLPGQSAAAVVPMESRFHGQCDWEPLWQELVQYAERFDLCTLQLNVSAPMIGEEYHAHWHRKQCSTLRELWRSEIPLIAGPITIGRLVLSGQKQRGSGVDCLSDVVDGLKPFQFQLEEMLRERLPASLVGITGVWSSEQIPDDQQPSNPHDSHEPEISLSETSSEVGQPVESSWILSADGAQVRKTMPENC
ncbi:hypothetical protein GC163_12245 [bacterium]|nr:hypothetical protein [bacterium]